MLTEAYPTSALHTSKLGFDPTFFAQDDSLLFECELSCGQTVRLSDRKIYWVILSK
jgi:hypothetical protein